MNVQKQWLRVLSLLFLLTLGLFPAYSVSAEEDALFEALMLNRFPDAVEIPNFTLPSLDGAEVSLSDFEGNVIFLNFWATWCPYCRKERPALQALYEKYKDQGFAVVSISIDSDEKDKVQEYVVQNKLTFPNLHDPDSRVAGQFGVTGVPVTYIIGADGKAIGGGIGPRLWNSEETYQLVKELLSHAE